ncbi:MAG TPA: hypothetical protein VIH42_05205, partial [Thermoguttaceae bacterium]
DRVGTNNVPTLDLCGAHPVSPRFCRESFNYPTNGIRPHVVTSTALNFPFTNTTLGRQHRKPALVHAPFLADFVATWVPDLR